MKKYIAALLTALLLLCTALSAGAVGPALTTTEAYCIMDADTGLVLAQQNMNEELHPASITKVMTLGLACQKAQGNWDGVKLTVSHEDVYSLAGTDSSHIALREGEEVPLQDALYGTMIASANDGANLLAEYFGGGTIEGGVAAMNAQVQALGLEHTHFANPHGISGDDHYTSCYDMAQILRWALTQPGFETIFTRLEMYTMAPTNVQPVTRYFSQQDKMRLSYSRYYIPAIRGSKIGYTNIARYSYVCLAEQNGVRLFAGTNGFFGKSLAAVVNARTPYKCLLAAYGKAKLAAYGIQNLQSLCHDLGPDAVAGQDSNMMVMFTHVAESLVILPSKVKKTPLP
mgnify:FL=1